MPPADVAEKIVPVLGVSVEYLVIGREYRQSVYISGYLQFRYILDDLAVLPDEIFTPIKAMIKTATDGVKREKSRC